MESVAAGLGAVVVLWTALEMVGTAIIQGAGQELARPWVELFNDWLLDRTGVKARQRRAVFDDAYRKTELTLMGEIGKPAAYRTSNMLQSITQSPDKARQLLLVMLEESAQPHDKADLAAYGLALRASDEERQHLCRFVLLLRANLFDTTEYKPLIEFCALEEARQVRQKILQHLERIALVVDENAQALRVTLVDNADFARERTLYLQQIEHMYREQEFVGFPDLREKRTAVLLEDIFVQLKLQAQEPQRAFLRELASSIWG